MCCFCAHRAHDVVATLNQCHWQQRHNNVVRPVGGISRRSQLPSGHASACAVAVADEHEESYYYNVTFPYAMPGQALAAHSALTMQAGATMYCLCTDRLSGDCSRHSYVPGGWQNNANPTIKVDLWFNYWSTTRAGCNFSNTNVIRSHVYMAAYAGHHTLRIITTYTKRILWCQPSATHFSGIYIT